MLSNAFFSFWRNVRHHPLYTALNVAGLALGIATFLTLALVVRYEYGFDRWLPAGDSIYRFDQEWTLAGQAPVESTQSSFKTYADLRTEYPQIKAGSRVQDQGVVLRVDDTVGTNTVTYVDRGFLDLIRLPLLHGVRQHALDGPADIVLSEEMARKYFGSIDVVGRHISVDHEGDKRDYVVTAVIRNIPADSSFQFDALAVIPSTLEQNA